MSVDPNFIFGYIKDKDEIPINNAEVKVYDKENFCGYVLGHSDSAGKYQLNIASVVKNGDTVNVQATVNNNSTMNSFVLDEKQLPKQMDIIALTYNSTDNYSVAVGETTSTYTNLTPQECYTHWHTNDGVQYCIDIRTLDEWNGNHISNFAVNSLEYPQHWPDLHLGTNLASFLSTFTGKSVIIYCLGGGRSVTASNLLINNGFTGTIYNMIGGIIEWEKAYPTLVTGTGGGYTITKGVYKLINGTYIKDSSVGTQTFYPDKTTYYKNEIVKCYATPNAGWKWYCWEGCSCVSAEPNRWLNPVTFIMDASKTVSAMFIPV